MPKRSIAEFRPTDRWMRDDPFYGDADIEAILRGLPLPDGNVAHARVVGAAGDERFEDVMVPRRVALVERLESAARSHHNTAEWQAMPTGRQLEDHYRRIESAATALLHALGTPEGERDAMPDALWLMGRPDNSDLQAVVRLRQWAQDGSAWAKGRPAVPSHVGDEALDEFVGCLTRIWRDVYGREPGLAISQGGRKRGGPFVRFVRAALAPVLGDHTPTEAQIADRIKNRKHG